MDYITLNNGVKMPQLGLGVFQVSAPDVCKKMIDEALDLGYRLIDTAASYQNEEYVGAAIRESGINREEIFLTTKLWVSDTSYEGAKKGFETSLKKLDTDYIDLYLIHNPMADYIGAYRAIEELYREGKIRAIGMCNCLPHVITDIAETVDVIPAVNQIEIHPFYQRQADLEIMEEYGIQPEAWSPFAEGKRDIFRNPILAKIGEKYGKTAAQVTLRWDIDRGIIVIPKSVNKERLQQNMDIWDFSLSIEDIAEIATLERGKSEIVDQFDPRLVQAFHGKMHK
jgi:diketogulonate reductase-like aldo/keto reductase